jgi:hypothetical protein
VDRWRVLIKKEESNLVDYFGVRRLESRELCIWIHKIAKSKISKREKSVVGPAFAERVGNRYFRIFKVKGSGFFVPRFPKSRDAIRISENRHFWFQQLKGRETRKEKSRSREIQSSEIVKGVIILFDQKVWFDASCLIMRA